MRYRSPNRLNCPSHRPNKPTEPAVVTVGSIHGGTKQNPIGNDCHLQITVRSYSDNVRQQILSAIGRKAKAIAQSHNAPEPEVTVSEGTPSLINDADLTARPRNVFIETIGLANVDNDKPSMGGAQYYPDVEPSLRIGIQTMTAAALNLLAR